MVARDIPKSPVVGVLNFTVPSMGHVTKHSGNTPGKYEVFKGSVTECSQNEIFILLIWDFLKSCLFTKEMINIFQLCFLLMLSGLKSTHRSTWQLSVLLIILHAISLHISYTWFDANIIELSHQYNYIIFNYCGVPWWSGLSSDSLKIL